MAAARTSGNDMQAPKPAKLNMLTAAFIVLGWVLLDGFTAPTPDAEPLVTRLWVLNLPNVQGLLMYKNGSGGWGLT